MPQEGSPLSAEQVQNGSDVALQEKTADGAQEKTAPMPTRQGLQQSKQSARWKRVCKSR
jgi:hypothetical protein